MWAFATRAGRGRLYRPGSDCGGVRDRNRSRGEIRAGPTARPRGCAPVVASGSGTRGGSGSRPAVLAGATLSGRFFDLQVWTTCGNASPSTRRGGCPHSRQEPPTPRSSKTIHGSRARRARAFPPMARGRGLAKRSAPRSYRCPATQHTAWFVSGHPWDVAGPCRHGRTRGGRLPGSLESARRWRSW